MLLPRPLAVTDFKKFHKKIVSSSHPLYYYYYYYYYYYSIYTLVLAYLFPTAICLILSMFLE